MIAVHHHGGIADGDSMRPSIIQCEWEERLLGYDRLEYYMKTA